jgi:muconolactone D-isomerase
MAEFLIFADNNFPVDGDSKERTQHIRAGERERAAELRESGNLKRLWRRPGSTGWIALWEAADATELHDQLASLPMFPYLDISIEALATHPQER